MVRLAEELADLRVLRVDAPQAAGQKVDVLGTDLLGHQLDGTVDVVAPHGSRVAAQAVAPLAEVQGVAVRDGLLHPSDNAGRGRSLFVAIARGEHLVVVRSAEQVPPRPFVLRVGIDLLLPSHYLPGVPLRLVVRIDE